MPNILSTIALGFIYVCNRKISFIFSPHISFCDLLPILRIVISFAAPTSIAFEGKIANNDNHKKYAVKKGE